MLVSPTTKKKTALEFKLRSACHESRRTSTELHKEAQQPEQLELQPPSNFKVRHYTVCVEQCQTDTPLQEVAAMPFTAEPYRSL